MLRCMAICLALTAASAFGPAVLRPSSVALFRSAVQRSRTLVAQQQLPPGWYTSIDPQSGQTYYCNEQTGVCQFDLPGAQGGAAQSLPPGWYSTVDPQSGQTYYCNEQTGVCQFDVPNA